MTVSKSTASSKKVMINGIEERVILSQSRSTEEPCLPDTYVEERLTQRG